MGKTPGASTEPGSQEKLRHCVTMQRVREDLVTAQGFYQEIQKLTPKVRSAADYLEAMKRAPRTGRVWQQRHSGKGGGVCIRQKPD